MFQFDVSNFLQSSPEDQPMYEEISQLHSDQSNGYVDTSSSYQTLPLESEYSESEQGLFLIQVNAHNKPFLVSKDSKVYGCKTNENFYIFQKKLPGFDTVKKAKDDMNSYVVNHSSILDYFHYGRTLIQSQSIITQYDPCILQSRKANKSYPSNTLRKAGPVDDNVHEYNQNNFLHKRPRTDVSGSNDWLDQENHNSHSIECGITKYDADFYERPSCPSPPDLISNKCRMVPISPIVISTSDVTVSPSSSESYQECRF